MGMAKLILGDVLKRKKMSKRRFAKALDYPYSNVFRYFREGYDPRLSDLNRFAGVLGVKVKDLLKEDSAKI